MNKIAPADVLDLVQYEKRRDEAQASAMAARKARRAGVGPFVSVAFENRETVLYQIQEMCRVERIVDDDRIRFEVDTYNELVPGPGELKATLFIELTSDELVRKWLPKFLGIESAVSLEIAGAGSCRAKGEEGRSQEAVTSTVHYLTFPLTSAQADAVRAGARCRLTVGLPDYDNTADVAPETVAALGADLTEG